MSSRRVAGSASAGGGAVARRQAALFDGAVRVILQHAAKPTGEVIAACETLWRQCAAQTELTYAYAAYAKGCPRALLDALRARMGDASLCTAVFAALLICELGSEARAAAAIEAKAEAAKEAQHGASSEAASAHFQCTNADAATIVHAVRAHMDSAPLVRHACDFIHGISADCANVVALLANGAAELLVAVFERYVMTEEAVAAVARTPFSESRLRCIPSVPSEALVDSPIALFAVGAVQALTAIEETRAVLIRAGFVPILFDCLLLHASNADTVVASHAIQALHNLLSHWQAVRIEWYQCVAAAMLMHAADASFVASACSLLMEMALRESQGASFGSKSPEIPAPVVRAIISMMRRHPCSPSLAGQPSLLSSAADVARLATAALRHMSLRIPLSLRLLTATAALQAGSRVVHASSADLQPRRDLVDDVCGILFLLLRKPFVPRADTMPLDDIARFLVAAAYRRGNVFVPNTVHEVFDALCFLTTTEDGCNAVVCNGGDHLATTALTVWYKRAVECDIDIVAAILELIRRLAERREDLAVRMASAELPCCGEGPSLPLVFQAILCSPLCATRHTMNLVGAAGSACAAMAQYEPCRELFMRSGFGSALVATLRRGPGPSASPHYSHWNAFVACRCCWVLRTLAASRSTAGCASSIMMQLVDAGILHVLHDTISTALLIGRTGTSESRWWLKVLVALGCGALRNLAAAPDVRAMLLAQAADGALVTVLQAELARLEVALRLPAAVAARRAALADKAASDAQSTSTGDDPDDADAAMLLWPACGGLLFLACDQSSGCHQLQRSGAARAASAILRLQHDRRRSESESMRKSTASSDLATAQVRDITDRRLTWAACGVLCKMAEAAAVAHDVSCVAVATGSFAAVAASFDELRVVSQPAPSTLRLLQAEDKAGLALVDALRDCGDNSRVACAASAALGALALDARTKAELLELGSVDAVSKAWASCRLQAAARGGAGAPVGTVHDRVFEAAMTALSPAGGAVASLSGLESTAADKRVAAGCDTAPGVDGGQ